MKKMPPRPSLRFLLFFLTVLPFLPGALESEAESSSRLVILPFFTEQTEDPARGAVCPICRSVYRPGTIAPGARHTLTRLLHEKMAARKIFEILPPEEVEKALSPSLKEGLEKDLRSTVMRLGKAQKAEFLLMGYLFRFEERIGSSLGVERPASVGFDLHLFRVRDGAEVWKGRFDETQKPLSDDLLRIGSFLKRRASWVTAEVLAGDGMDEVLKKFPSLKELEERP